MTYFSLATDCFLVEGESDGAIYDVGRRRVFLLDEGAHALIRRCEDKEPLGDWLGTSGMRFLEGMQEKGLGFFDSEPHYVDKLLLHQPIEWKGICMVPDRFIRADWAITNDCDLDCAFCARGDETISWQSCQTCLRRDKETRNQWVPKSAEDFVAQIVGLGAELLHVRGGNPLLAWDYLLRIVRAARKTSLALTITTPGTGRGIADLVDLCADGRVQLNIVMFGFDAQVTSATCGQHGVLREQLALIDALASRQLPFSVTFLLTCATRERRCEILDLAGRLWNGEPSFAEVYAREAVREGLRLSYAIEETKPLTPWRSSEEFFFRTRYNGCIFGNFEVSSDGKLRACAGIHRVLGDVANSGLQKVLASSELYDVWELNKGNVQPCKHCALRYACLDCSVFELEGASCSNIKEAYCSHDPSRPGARAHRSNWIPNEFVEALTLPDPGCRPSHVQGTRRVRNESE